MLQIVAVIFDDVVFRGVVVHLVAVIFGTADTTPSPYVTVKVWTCVNRLQGRMSPRVCVGRHRSKLTAN